MTRHIVSQSIMTSEVAGMPQRQELIKGSSDSLLLCLIGEQSMYGYQIIKELERARATLDSRKVRFTRLFTV